MKALEFLKKLPKALFYNKQTSVALVMAVGATAAYGTFAAPTATSLEVLGTGSYPLTVKCENARHKSVPTERLSRADNQVGITFRMQTSRTMNCQVTSGSLQKNISVLPGDRAKLDFAQK